MEKLIRNFFENKNLDDTVLQYIISIASSNNSEDIEEGVVPLLLQAGCTTDENTAKEMCHNLLRALGLRIPEVKSDKLQNTVKITDNNTPKDILLKENSPLSKKTLKNGNTYEIVAPEERDNPNEDPYIDYLKPSIDVDSCKVSLQEFISLTFAEDPTERKKALRDLCPCHVKHDVKEFWDRILAMTDDPDPVVRYQVLHNLCDGSPKTREDDVIKALETMHNDSDPYIRRRVHQVLSNYRRTGKWNIL